MQLSIKYRYIVLLITPLLMVAISFCTLFLNFFIIDNLYFESILIPVFLKIYQSVNLFCGKRLRL